MKYRYFLILFIFVIISSMDSVQGQDIIECGNTITFTYAGERVTYGTVRSTDNRCWLDRNLGASRVATSSTDEQAYGDLYQWGRDTDGHQKRNSPTTRSISRSYQPEHGSVITASSDWLNPRNNSLWQGVNGINNPCPDGFRLPTAAEWEAEKHSWDSNNIPMAFNSPLKLPAAGYSSRRNIGSLSDVGSGGGFWSSSVRGEYARHLLFSSHNANMSNGYRERRYSVRCIKD